MGDRYPGRYRAPELGGLSAGLLAALAGPSPPARGRELLPSMTVCRAGTRNRNGPRAGASCYVADALIAYSLWALRPRAGASCYRRRTASSSRPSHPSPAL
jgi:hypothetical protein